MHGHVNLAQHDHSAAHQDEKTSRAHWNCNCEARAQLLRACLRTQCSRQACHCLCMGFVGECSLSSKLLYSAASCLLVIQLQRQGQSKNGAGSLSRWQHTRMQVTPGPGSGSGPGSSGTAWYIFCAPPASGCAIALLLLCTGPASTQP